MPPRAFSSSSTSNPPSSKKRKAAQDEADSNDPPPPPSPSTSFFFEDGNILLHVGSTLFKVHRGVLQKAEVFADTLLVGGHLGGKEAGGIPTIKLDDLREDWEVFLRAIYDGVSFSKKLPTLLETRSMLLLADKYNHSSVLESATAALIARSVWVQIHEDGEQSGHNSDLYDHDEEFPAKTTDAECGLLALQEEFSLARSSVRWIHNRITSMSPSLRAILTRSYKEVGEEGWHPAISNQTRFSIFLRADAFAQLASKATRSSVRNLHSSRCLEGSLCRREVDLQMVDIYTSLAQQYSYKDAIDTGLTIGTWQEGEDTAVL